MNENFNRAPGAGRIRSPTADPGFVGTAGEPNTSTAFYNQTVSPLRQPRTSPSFTESPHNDSAGEGRELSDKVSNVKDERKGIILSMFFSPYVYSISFINLVTKRIFVEFVCVPKCFESINVTALS